MTDQWGRPADQWWREHDEIVRLAYWMLEHHSEARDIVLMVEKPWKFEDEYRQALADNAAEEAEAMHRLPGESYLGMLMRNRTKTPSVSFDTQDTSGDTAKLALSPEAESIAQWMES